MLFRLIRKEIMRKIEISPFEPLFTAGLAAEKVGISVMTLRLYEQKGLIIPHRTDSGRRFFSIHDLECVLCIRELIQEHGLNIEGIRHLIGLSTCGKLNECSEESRIEFTAPTELLISCDIMRMTVSYALF